MLILKVIHTAEWKGFSLDPRPFWPCKKGSGEKPCAEMYWALECCCWCWWKKECQLNKQGVVTYMSSVEAFARFLIGKKCAWSLDRSLLKFLITSFLKSQRSNCSRTFLIWRLQLRGCLNPLINPQKGLWLLDSILIPVTNASTRFDYPISIWVPSKY